MGMSGEIAVGMLRYEMMLFVGGLQRVNMNRHPGVRWTPIVGQNKGRVKCGARSPSAWFQRLSR